MMRLSKEARTRIDSSIPNSMICGAATRIPMISPYRPPTKKPPRRHVPMRHCRPYYSKRPLSIRRRDRPWSTPRRHRTSKPRPISSSTPHGRTPRATIRPPQPGSYKWSRPNWIPSCHPNTSTSRRRGDPPMIRSPSYTLHRRN